MAKHSLYDQFFTTATALSAEGARVGVTTCKLCFAAVLLDPRDEFNAARKHIESVHPAAMGVVEEQGNG